MKNFLLLFVMICIFNLNAEEIKPRPSDIWVKNKADKWEKEETITISDVDYEKELILFAIPAGGFGVNAVRLVKMNFSELKMNYKFKYNERDEAKRELTKEEIENMRLFRDIF